MGTIGDPNAKSVVDWSGYPQHRERRTTANETEQLPHHSGSFLLAALMWSAYTVSAFLVMLGVIAPTWGNVFIVLVFLIVGVMVSFAMNGGKT